MLGGIGLGLSDFTSTQALSSAKIIRQQSEIDELRKRQQWRRLSESAQAELLSELRRLGAHSFVISYVPGDAEAENFGRLLYDIFRSAGWVPARQMLPYGIDLTGKPSPMGIQMYCQCSSMVDIPPVVGVLIGALKSAEIAVWRHVGADNDLPESQSITVLVGHKPQDIRGDDYIH